MRCAVKNCLSNEDGYCMDSSYVSIDENGECDQMPIIEADNKEDKAEKEDKELLVEKIRKLQTYKLAPELEKLVSLEKVIAILEGEENVF